MELNAQQLEAVNSNNRTILCLAGAGSGKTKTLISRVIRLVNDGVDPTRILALTFTNAAAFEMRERYKVAPGIDLSKGVPEFRTFHSFCYSLIIKDAGVRNRIGYSKIPEVCDDAKFKEIKQTVKMQLGIKLSDADLDGDSRYLNREQKDQKALYTKALVKAIRDENVITFDIMCYNVCELFEKKDPCIEKYRQKYQHLLVDETQDCDPRQFRFIASFPETTNFFLCGDILQNVYQFRNCTNAFIKQLAKDPSWTVIKLYKNYRSTTNICEFANKFSRYSSDEFRIEMKGQRDGEDPEVIYGSWTDYDNPVCPNHLKILVDRLKDSKTESAIICRSNREVAAVKNALTSAGIEFSSKSKSTDTLDIIQSALSNDYMLEWLATKLEGKDYGDYIRLSSQVENPDIRWFLDVYGNREKIKKAAEKIIEIRNITASEFSPKDKFELITKILRIKTKCHFDGDDNTTNKQVVEMIKNQVQEMTECTLYCGTIHSVKGLEYDTVYVMGVNDKLFQLGTEEMDNLYYVAITRPKQKLVVFRR